MLDTVFDSKNNDSDKGRDEALNYKKVDVVWRDKYVPISIEVLEER